MILLDTCALLWLANGDKSLSDRARTSLQENASHLYVSSFSAWEIAIKHSKGKLKLPRLKPVEWFAGVLKQHGLTEISVDSIIATASVALPGLHADPADRVLIATAQVHGLSLLTPDPLIRQYPNLRTVW